MDKSRQQFEEFIKFHMNDAEKNNKFETANNGLNYSDKYVDLMWISWKASRENLINNLEPVGYINSIGIFALNRKLNSVIRPNKDDNSITLYRLDK